MTLRTPQILISNPSFIKLLTPSKSSPSTPREVCYYPSGKHHCDCPGHGWKVKTHNFKMKWCRHHTMTTIPKQTVARLSDWKEQVKHYLTRGYVKAAWAFIHCQHPELRPPYHIHCSNCHLYPKTCNKHPMYFGLRLRHKPLIWKLQTAIYNKRRKEARRLFRRFLKEL